MPALTKFEAPSIKRDWSEFIGRGLRLKTNRASDRHPNMFVCKGHMSLHALVRDVLPGAAFYAEEKDTALLMTLSKSDAHKAIRPAVDERSDDTKFGFNVSVSVLEPATGKRKDILITYAVDGKQHAQRFASGIVHLAAKWIYENYHRIGRSPDNDAIEKLLAFKQSVTSFKRLRTARLQMMADDLGLGLTFVQTHPSTDRIVRIIDTSTGALLMLHHHSKPIVDFMIERYATMHAIDMKDTERAVARPEQTLSSRRLEEIDEYLCRVRAEFYAKFGEELEINIAEKE